MLQQVTMLHSLCLSKSLRKPVIPVAVGEGSEWDQTVIGALVASGSEEIHSLQVKSVIQFTVAMIFLNLNRTDEPDFIYF